MNQAKRRLLTTIPLNSPSPAPPNGPERADTRPTPNSEEPNRTGMPIRLLALFTAITVVMSWPYPLQIQTSLYNWSDALLNSWTLAWGTRILLTDPFNLFNANIFYPYPNTLAYSESLVPQTALAMPIILLTGLPSLAHNLLALSSFVLAAFGAYLLVYDLTRSRGASLVAGVIYTFTSYKMMHFAHLQLLSSQWLPFALLYARRMFNLPGTRARVRSAIIFAVFFALQALSSFYYAFFIAVAFALYVAYEFALEIWHKRASRWIRIAILPTALAVGLIALLTIPFALPYFAVQRELGLERDTRDVEYYAATVRTYFSVPDGNWVYARWLAPGARMTGSGERDFIGVVAFALVLIGLVKRGRGDAAKGFYILLAAVAVVLSFGAGNQILTFPKFPGLTLPFYLPFRYLFEYVPGFKALRGPDRFAYLAVLSAAVVAAYGVRALCEQIRSTRPLVASTLPPLLALLICGENFAAPIQVTNPATLARPVPGFAQFIAHSPPDAVVLEIPMIFEKESLAWPQYYSIYHWHSLVNGFSGFFPPGYAELASAVNEFPSDTSLALLNELGVQIVVVHNDLLTPAEQATLKARTASPDPRVRIAAQFGNDDVYQVTGGGWGVELARAIPDGARVELQNDVANRRELFEIAAAFLSGHALYGDRQAAYRTLSPVNQSDPPDYVITNADKPPADFTRRVWANNYLMVWTR